MTLENFFHCERCSIDAKLVETPSQTRYTDSSGNYDEDKNKPFWLCTDCAEEYTQDMKDRWNDYWAGRF